MESERPVVSRSGDRPVTRWRREQEYNDKSQTFSEHSTSAMSRSYSKMERPTSRRGIKTDITEYGISRPPTSSRNALSRPPSPNISSNRISTAGSRINTMSSPHVARINSSLMRNFSQINSLIFDRPITQQGLAGIRPGSSRGVPKLTRHIQDKQYYKQLLQQKIQELNQEIATISREVEKQNKEKSSYINYDQTDVATELTEIENQLFDCNTAFDKILLNADKEEVKKEAKRFKELSDHKDAEIHRNIQKRRFAEKKLIELNRNIESKEKVSDRFTDNIDLNSKYVNDELQVEKIELQKEIDNLKTEYDKLFAEKSQLEEKISLSPIKYEAYKLYVKIFELEQKKNKLLEVEKNGLSPEEEKVKLTKKFKQENLDFSAAEKQIIEIQKKIADAEEELEQLDINTDENQIEKQSKYNEYKNREANLTILEKNKIIELEKLGHLEELIVQRLEHISNKINENIDSSILTDDEVEMLKTLMEQNFEIDSEKSFEELKQESIRLQQISNKLEILEIKVNNGMNGSENHIELGKIKQRDLLDLKEEFIEQEKMTNEKLQTVNKDYTKLKEKIEQNEIYRPISILEDKLRNASQENEYNEQPIEEQESEIDYTLLIEKLFSLVAQYNVILINEKIKSIY